MKTKKLITTCSNSINVTLALMDDNTLWGCGQNYNYILSKGLNQSDKIPIFKQITSISDVKDCGIIYNAIIVLKNDNTVWSLGAGYYGVFPNNNEFTKIADNVSRIFVGPYNLFISKLDGTLWGRGLNDSGSLGIGNTSKNIKEFMKCNVTNVTNMFLGAYNTHAFTSSGSYSTGHNYSCELGLSTKSKDSNGNIIINKDSTDRYEFVKNNFEYYNDVKDDYYDCSYFSANVTPIILNNGDMYICGWDRTYEYLNDGYKTDYNGGLESDTYFFQKMNGKYCKISGYTFDIVLKANNEIVLIPPYNAPTYDNLNTQSKIVDVYGTNSGLIVKLEDGTYWALGKQYYGNLGIGNLDNPTVFTPVLLPENLSISGQDGSLGSKFSPFSLNYTIYNYTSNQASIVIKLDDITTDTLNVQHEKENTFTISPDMWNNVIPYYGMHKITITATNGVFDCVRVYTFEKSFGQNTPPSIPPWIKVQSNDINITKLKVGDKTLITWGTSTDKDNNPIVYELSFFDGVSWVVIANKIKGTSYIHTLPTMNDTIEAKYRIRAYDDVDFSGYRVSDPFEVSSKINIGLNIIFEDEFEDYSVENDYTEDLNLGVIEEWTELIYKIISSNEDMNFKTNVTLGENKETQDIYLDSIDSVNINEEYTINLSETRWNKLKSDITYYICINSSNSDNTCLTSRYITFRKYYNESEEDAKKETFSLNISGTNENKGFIQSSFDYEYHAYYVGSLNGVYSGDTSLGFIIKIDDKQIESFSGEINQNYSISINNQWNDLSYGVHRITIIASNDNNETVERKITFCKNTNNINIPFISGTDEYLGIKNDSFMYDFFVNSVDSDVLQTTIYLDGKIIDDYYNTDKNMILYANINTQLFNKLDDMKHTIQIYCNNGTSIVSRTLTFDKKTQDIDYKIIDLGLENMISAIDLNSNDEYYIKFKIENMGQIVNLSGMDIVFEFGNKQQDISSECIDITNGIVTIPYNKELTCNTGKINCDLRFAKDDKTITSQTFKIKVW